MAERKAMFRFVMAKEVVISTKRVLSSLVIQHIRDSLAFSNRSVLRLRESIHFLKKLDSMQTRLLSHDLLEDDADEREDHRLIREALEHLTVAQKALELLRLRKIEAGVAFEEAIDPVFAPPPGKKTKPLDLLAPAEPVPATPIVMQLVDTQVEAPPVPQPEGNPAPVVVKFDEELLAQARKELSNALAAKGFAENEI